MTPHKAGRRKRYRGRVQAGHDRANGTYELLARPAPPVDELTLEQIERRLGLLVTTDEPGALS